MDGNLPEDVHADIWPAFKQAFQSDNRGTRLNDILAFGRSAAIQVCLAGGKSTGHITEDVVPLVKAYFDCPVTG